MTIQLLNDPEDISWLRSTHLRRLNPPVFNSFEIVGNEDAPQRVKLYGSRHPSVFEGPIANYTQDARGNLSRA